MEIDQIGVRERIREIKEENSMTQKEFSQSIGIQQSDLSSYFSGKKSIGITLINRVCLEYSINKNWLLTGKVEKKLSESNFAKKIEESETVKELIAALKRRDEHVEALIRVNEKHADNFAELLRQMKKTDAPKGDGAGCADASGFSDK